MVEKDKKDYKGITLIKSPTEVSHLMKDLWINHKNGIPIPKNNVFIVNLPHMEQKENKSTNKGDNLIDKKGGMTRVYTIMKKLFRSFVESYLNLLREFKIGVKGD